MPEPEAENTLRDSIPVSELMAMGAPYNPRKIDDHDLAALRRSIRFFGAVEPVVVNRRSNHIVGGHQRVKAAQAEGIDEFPVVWVDLDDPGEKQLNLALNRISGQWDDEKLRELLADLETTGADLDLTGFDDKELARLLQTIADGETDPDAVPSEVEERCSPGDLWQLGQHRLVCGDATDPETLARLWIPEAQPTLCVTDPPYGIRYEYASHDDSSPEENRQLVESVFGLCPGLPRVWTPGKMNLARELAREPSAKIVVWHKKFAAAGNGLGGASTWEPILISGNPSVKQLDNDLIVCMTDRSEVDGISLRELHSCPKPVELFCTLLGSLSERHEVIYEPFCGSGTCMIACEQLDRICYATEIDPHYCDVILARWEAFTGEKAVRLDAST